MLPTNASASESGSRPRLDRLLAHGRTADVLIAGVLAIATFFVHSVSYVLAAPFWLDETWVAVSTRFPLRDLPQTTSVTPLGWTLLLRTAVVGGEQRLRLLPLAFSALSVLVAYLIARSVPWGSQWWSRLAGAVAGIAVLLAPSSLIRNDLKQYTADAFVTLTVLLLVSRLERSWSRARLAMLSAACVIGFLISAVALFVATAAFVALIAVCLVCRNLRRALEAAVSGATAAVTLGVLYLAIYKPHVQKDLIQYWRPFYPPLDQGVAAALGYLHRRGGEMASYLGMGPLIIALLLVAAGVLTLARSGRPVLALTAPALLVEMITLGAVKKYPLLDERTSHFLTVTFAVFAAIGVAGLCSVLARRQVVLGTAVVALAAALFVVNVRHDIREQILPPEDVRTPTAYVAANRRPADIIVVSAHANFGFSYYWPHGRPSLRPSTVFATGFQTGFPEQREIIVATDRTQPAIQSALERAARQAAGVPGARIWIVRMHVDKIEDHLWRAAIGRQRVQLKSVIACSLLLLTPLPAGTEKRHDDLAAASCH